jgi:hypothetical protein
MPHSVIEISSDDEEQNLNKNSGSMYHDFENSSSDELRAGAIGGFKLKHKPDLHIQISKGSLMQELPG